MTIPRICPAPCGSDICTHKGKHESTYFCDGIAKCGAGGCKPYHDRSIVAFVDGLTEEQLEMLKEYLKEGENNG